VNATDEARSADVLAAKATLPEHVVFRSFAQETVVLNLDTGTYHGLDPVGGRLLEILPLVGDVREAVAKIAEEYSTPVAVVEADVVEFCLALQTRGLIRLDEP
jgi:hypothetical protein